MENEQENTSERMILIESLAESLLNRRNEAVEARAASGVERRWSEDKKTFDGLDSEDKSSMIDSATGAASVKGEGPRRSKVIINVIRGKCETAEGRFSDIQFPVDDRNWGLKVTPNPEIADALKDERDAAQDGEPITRGTQPVQVKEIAKDLLQTAKDKMAKMETEIDDQLTESSFNSECRKVVRDAVRLGTGILKGPLVVKQLKKSWMQKEGSRAMETSEDFKPASKRVAPECVYPDPECEEDISRAAYMWERDEILPREVRSLIGVPGYIEETLLQVLGEDPKRTTVGQEKDSLKHKISQSLASRGSSYERWEYHGDLKTEDLEALDIDVEDAKTESVSACVVFINDRPVKVMLNTLDSGELPYDFFQWTEVSGSPWGQGIPRIALWQYRVLNAAWRVMMDNAGDSAGANIVLGSGISPDDGIWEITGKKIWRALGEVEDVGKAFAQFQLTNNQVELQNIIELALKFIDMETSLPMMFQGEKGEIPETLGATNIMVDANNVALRARVKLWDDRITRPHITRYYDWNMQYNENEDIKGDYSVDVRGVSALLEKDQQATTLTQVWSLKGDPDIGDIVDWKKASKQLFQALHLDILKSEEDMANQEEKPPPPQDPEIAVAQIRAKTEIDKATMVQEATMKELEAKAQMAADERVHDAKMKEYDVAIKQMEFSEKSGISLEKIKANLALGAAKLTLQRDLSSQKGGGEQVITPASEPTPIAKPGHAFED